MADVLLIDNTHIAKIRTISKSIDLSAQLNPFIREAQDLDIKPVLGAEFFTDLCANLLVQANVDLLDGKTYPTTSGTSIEFKGLRYALSYFAWARYSIWRNQQDTPFGMGSKVTQWSKPTEQDDLHKKAHQDRINGTAYLQECVSFLNTFPSVYTLYRDSCGKSSPASLSSVKYVTT